MGRRQFPRKRAVLPVQVTGTDANGTPFKELAHTLDMSSGGALLGGFKPTVKVGEIVTVQHKKKSSQFRVAWVAGPRTGRQGELGLAVVGRGNPLWPEQDEEFLDDYRAAPAVAAPAPVPHAVPPPPPEPAEPESLRRSTRIRFQTALHVESLDPDQEFSEQLQTLMVNAHGCGAQSRKVLARETRVRITVLATGVNVLGQVAACVPLSGSLWALGFETDTPGNIWGVATPPADWGTEGAPASAPVAAPAMAAAAPQSSGPAETRVTHARRDDTPAAAAAAPGDQADQVVSRLREDCQKLFADFAARASADLEKEIQRHREQLRQDTERLRHTLQEAQSESESRSQSGISSLQEHLAAAQKSLEGTMLQFQQQIESAHVQLLQSLTAGQQAGAPAVALQAPPRIAGSAAAASAEGSHAQRPHQPAAPDGASAVEAALARLEEQAIGVEQQSKRSAKRRRQLQENARSLERRVTEMEARFAAIAETVNRRVAATQARLEAASLVLDESGNPDESTTEE